MIILKDNDTANARTSDDIKAFLSLKSIANRSISELSDEYGNSLLIYPHSFYQCEDEAGQQPLLTLQTKGSIDQCTEATIKTGNIVGFIGVNGRSVSIHSRFANNVNEDFFLHYMLRKVMCINVFNLSHGTTDEQVFDFLLYLFPKLLNEALTQGIYKEYQRNEYNDANVRGPIDFSRHLRLNLPFNGRIAYGTREFSHDNHVTQLVRHTIEHISHTKHGKMLLENDAETRTSVAQIISATPCYCQQMREQIIKSNLKAISHPYFTSYAPLQKLCLRILRHEHIKYGKNDNKIYGILFDASYLWEEYLATILTKHGFKHPRNKQRTGRIYLAKNSALPRYPDYYNEADGIIIDAKYKKTIDTRDDINQIITYMYRLRGKLGIFIRPTATTEPAHTLSLLGYGEDNDARIRELPYPIPRDADNMTTFTRQIATSENHLLTNLHPLPPSTTLTL